MPTYLFGDHSLDVERRELLRGSSHVPVEPQVFDLLEFLVRSRDRVLSKDELIATVWKGRVVSDSTLASRINAARKAVRDSGGEQRLIRTYARKGVRFVGEVRETPGATPQQADPPGSLFTPHGKPCIAVLPFANLSGSKAQEYFSEGVTEDIITALSRHRSLLVLARNSTFALGDRNADVRRIALELGARYLVRGSVRRAGRQVRISAQLVDSESGRQLWAERYDRSLGGLFEVQDQIASQIAAQVEPEIGSAERTRATRKPPQAFDAWDFFRLGTKHFYQSTAEDNREALRLFRRAIELDPGLAQAYGFLAYAILLDMVYFDAAPDEAHLDEAIELARRGVALDDRDAVVRFTYGRVLLARQAYDEAIAELRIAIELNPNLAAVHCGLGDTLAYKGRFAEAFECFKRAIDLSPYDPLRWAFLSYGAMAYLFARQFTLAEDWARKAVRLPGCHYSAYAHRVAALGHLHRPKELASALADLRKVRPDFTRRLAGTRLFYVKDSKQVALYLDGLRKAGVPEDQP